jgi:hypothetical protein
LHDKAFAISRIKILKPYFSGNGKLFVFCLVIAHKVVFTFVASFTIGLMWEPGLRGGWITMSYCRGALQGFLNLTGQPF